MLRLVDPTDSDWTFTPFADGQIAAQITTFPQGADGWELGATTSPSDPKQPENSVGIAAATASQSVSGNSGETWVGLIRWTFLGNAVSDWSPVKTVVIV